MSENFDKYNHACVAKKFATDNLEVTLNCNDFITVSDLYEIYKAWCHKNNYRITTLYIFIREMKKIEGVQHTRQRVPKTWKTQDAKRMFRYIKLKA